MKICFNGDFFPADRQVITAQNRSFKWGDGVFETIKVLNGKILLEAYHFDRLFLSLKMLQIAHDPNFTRPLLSKLILELCEQNNCRELARVRFAVFRNEHNLAAFLIEANPLFLEYHHWNENGWTIDMYPHARKSTDAFSNLKSANHLPYVMAGLYSTEKKLDEVLVLNSSHHICDGSKTNVFLISKDQIITPALHQGCINGVMRRHLITELKSSGWDVKQDEVSEQDVLDADEVFLTNALVGMKWVGTFKGKSYEGVRCFEIFQKMILPLYGEI